MTGIPKQAIAILPAIPAHDIRPRLGGEQPVMLWPIALRTHKQA